MELRNSAFCGVLFVVSVASTTCDIGEVQCEDGKAVDAGTASMS